MGLGDELKKAGFIDKKKLRQQKHQERVERKQKGVEGLEQERAEREQDLKQKKLEERREKKRLAEEENRLQKERERLHQLKDIVEANTVRERIKGPRSFFFVARDGSVPFLQVDIEISKRLETGSLAIIEMEGDPRGTFRLLPRDAAERVRDIDPEVIRFGVALR